MVSNRFYTSEFNEIISTEIPVCTLKGPSIPLYYFQKILQNQYLTLFIGKDKERAVTEGSRTVPLHFSRIYMGAERI